MAAALVTAVVPVGMNWMRKSPYFRLSVIDITTDGSVTREQIAAAAGVFPGMPIMEAGPADIRQRIECIASVKSASVRRVLPAKLIISVKQRVPVGYLCRGAMYQVDEDGVVLPVDRERLRRDLPLVFGLNDSVADTAGDRRVLSVFDRLRLLSFRKAVLAVPAQAAGISQIDFSHAGSVSFIRVADGAEITLDESDLNIGLAHLGRLTEVMKEEKDSVDRRHINLCGGNLAFVY
jgi:cell division septal protein FtsQ